MSTQFQLGDEGSRAKLLAMLNEIRDKGVSVLSSLEDARLKSLLEFDRRLSAINSRRQRANRVKSSGVVARFVVSDFLDLDQGHTTATVRADASAATLRERNDPQDATVRALRFSTTTGVVEKLDAKDQLWRVHTTNGATPTGTFELELVNPVQLTLMVLDIAATPSSPTITVEVSPNGVTYTSATSVTLNGYRITAWIEPSKVRFVRLTITPSHPDNLLGDSYTFGLTDFAADGLDFHLRAEVLTDLVTWVPQSSQMRFNAEELVGVTYFLALGVVGTTPVFAEVHPGDILNTPGVTDVAPVSVGFVGTNWTTVASSLDNVPLQAGSYVKPTTPNSHRYLVTVAGTTVTEPSWPTTNGNTVTSGGVTFTCEADGAGQQWTVSLTTLASTFLALGTKVRPTVPNGFIYEVTTQGTTAASEPVWPTTLGNTVASGSVTFTCRREGLLNQVFSGTVLLDTVSVTEDGSGDEIRFAPSLDPADANVAKLVNKYAGLTGTNMYIIRDDIAQDVGKTYTISYSTGPSAVQAQLRVVLSTEDRSLTPVFRGAILEEV